MPKRHARRRKLKMGPVPKFKGAQFRILHLLKQNQGTLLLHEVRNRRRTVPSLPSLLLFISSTGLTHFEQVPLTK
jgi:hypothetical protein